MYVMFADGNMTKRPATLKEGLLPEPNGKMYRTTFYAHSVRWEKILSQKRNQ